MRTKQIFAVLLAFFAAAASLNAAETLRVMSYNVLTSHNDEVNNWKGRKENLVADIKATDPDLLGLQEPFKNQLDYILESLGNDYAYVGAARDDGAEGGEYSPVLYKISKFELLDSGTFWLSETPDVPGKKGWGAACNRVVSWGKFRSKESGRIFVYADTHFDHVSEKARQESAKLVLKFKEENAADLPFLITGDFNSTEKDLAYKTITTSLRDARKEAKTTSGGERTFPSVFKKNEREGVVIDYIFISAPFQAESFTIHSNPPQKDPFPSDHFSIDAELTW